MAPRSRRFALLLAVALSGACGLTWEVLWQQQAALALGISSAGAAITLAALMAGLGLGGLLAARLAQRGLLRRPMLAYAIAELVIGVGGWLAPHGFALMAQLDTQLHATSPQLAVAMRLLLTATVLLGPAIAMGVTIPILAPYALSVGTNVAVVYGLNTFGAVLGVLATTFLVLPASGLAMTATWTAALNLVVAGWAFSQREHRAAQDVEQKQPWPPVGALVLAAASGMVILMLEVSWFRSLRAALQSSTESFAIILAAFLFCLSLGAWLAPRIRSAYPMAFWWLPLLAALAVLVTTPSVDQFDLIVGVDSASVGGTMSRLLSVLAVVLAPITLLGVIFPSLLSEHDSTTGSGRLYAANTLGAVLGALLAGFVLLGSIGATYTSWLAAALMAIAGVVMHPGRGQLLAAATAVVLGGSVAAMGVDDAAQKRVQGFRSLDAWSVLHVDEGPDSTVWVAENLRTHTRSLVIDGFEATSEGPGTQYMRWMGHLPALAAAKLDRALVICFGTGQTADALWQHGPTRLDIVEISQAVLDAGHFFESNGGVLQRPNVHVTASDGRAFLRRQTGARFDVITLEPMPPNLAGANNLYSTEFYELVASRLAKGGVVAQWLPYHLITAHHMRSIVASFRQTFPHTRLWNDPERGTGILLGGMRAWSLGSSGAVLPLPPDQIGKYFVLDRQQLTKLVAGAEPVTDDNQLLSYGLDRLNRSAHGVDDWALRLARRNRALVRAASAP